ncbi:MAG: helix-turn-helix domain-containing protein [Tannerella sp.]|jgi:transcriptional regulator with XRE-family HTH domain|nr:helix-turn-helix domain-containing protein [Tannerella sp.]
MNVSMKDIAEKLNVSTTTVSWVLSGQSDERRIGAAVQAKVLECAKEAFDETGTEKKYVCSKMILPCTLKLYGEQFCAGMLN